MGWKAAERILKTWKILRGDNVMINRGKDKGETGVIKCVFRSQNRVIVEGKNLVKKHVKPGQGRQGLPCRIGFKYLEDGTKVRFARGNRASGAIIPRPEILKIRKTPRPLVAGPKDTPMEDVLEKTYDAKTGKGMPPL